MLSTKIFARARSAARILACAPSSFLTIRKAASPRFQARIRDVNLQLFDATRQTTFDRHYVFHTAWASRVLAATRPREHVDLSGSLFFVAIASAFVPIRFFDYRPAELPLDNLSVASADLLQLPFSDGTIESLSCMHVVEHVGLGRYGEPVDPDGDLKAARELDRVLAIGGQLLFAVPLGGQSRVHFNAHRVYTYEQVLSMFGTLRLREFALIPEQGQPSGLIRNADPSIASSEAYACGCFHFEKV